MYLIRLKHLVDLMGVAGKDSSVTLDENSKPITLQDLLMMELSSQEGIQEMRSMGQVESVEFLTKLKQIVESDDEFENAFYVGGGHYDLLCEIFGKEFTENKLLSKEDAKPETPSMNFILEALEEFQKQLFGSEDKEGDLDTDSGCGLCVSGDEDCTKDPEEEKEEVVIWGEDLKISVPGSDETTIDATLVYNEEEENFELIVSGNEESPFTGECPDFKMKFPFKVDPSMVKARIKNGVMSVEVEHHTAETEFPLI